MRERLTELLSPALPADLLDAVPAGGTLFGEFPVLLAKGLVEAYEGPGDGPARAGHRRPPGRAGRPARAGRTAAGRVARLNSRRRQPLARTLRT
ncbi:hypothetical protein ACIP4Y_34215 [Streptomyces sp. NPDC088810]|uniref:hypothetical protein n=1 Tax=unclassified Streptomyces TaxID=2593676 RepID=UPI003830A37D